MYNEVGPFVNDTEPDLDADTMNHLEGGIVEAHRLVDEVSKQEGPKGEKGEKGDKGDKGDKGAKGDKGDPGADAAPQFTPEEVTALKALAAAGE